MSVVADYDECVLFSRRGKLKQEDDLNDCSCTYVTKLHFIVL